MYNSHTISVYIERPVEEVYEFLLDPHNLPRWAPLYSNVFKHLGGLEWLAETHAGRRVIRFAERNPYLVLDHSIFEPGTTPRTVPMRIFENDGGSEIAYTLLQHPEISDESFASEIEWLQADFAVLKSYLEADGSGSLDVQEDPAPS